MTSLARLLDTEFRRYFARRITRVMILLTIAIMVLVVAIVTARSAVRTVEPPLGFQPLEECVKFDQGHRLIDQQCVIEHGGNPKLGGVERFARVQEDHRIAVGRSFGPAVKGVGIGFMVVAFVVGASFIGAEFGAASLSTQLLFEPRRIRVVAMKALALALGTSLYALGSFALLFAFQYAGSAVRGVTAGLDGLWFARRLGDVLRVSAAVGAAAAISYAITVVARRTAAAIGILLGSAFLMQFVQGSERWRWLGRIAPFTCITGVIINEFDHREQWFGLHTLSGGWFGVAAWSVGLVAAAAAVFSRREVR